MLTKIYDFSFYIVYIYIAYSFFTEIFSKIFSFFKKNEYKFSTNFYVSLISFIEILMIISFNINGYFVYYGAFTLTYLFLLMCNFLFNLFKPYLKIILSIFLDVFLWLICVSETYVYKFKGDVYTLYDLKAAKTAFEVASNYDFTPDIQIVISIIPLFFTIFLICKSKFCKQTKNSIIGFVLSFVLCVPILIGFNFNSNLISNLGNINIYNKSFAVSNYGYPLFLYTDYILEKFEYPENFDRQKTLDYIDKIEEIPIDNNRKSAVNVICILDEAFYDMSLISQFDTNTEVLPLFHSPNDKNTLKGYTLVSTYGGGTANTEYEFLLQGNLKFLPKNSYVFSSFLKERTSSLVTVLKDNGFKTIAYHPQLKENWNRDIVYPLIGFDEFLNWDDYEHLDDKDLSFTGLLDDVCFDDIIDIYENKEKDEKLFIYTVTMQNHSPYSYNDESFYLNNIKSDKNDKVLDNYLSLMNKTDLAIQKLFNYFDNVDEPTIILVFGDHAPGSLFDYNRMAVRDDIILKMHSTPYLIHTNFDTVIPEVSDCISISYLQNILMDMANLKKSKEQLFVNQYIDKYPILNAEFYGTLDNYVKSYDYPEDLSLYRDFCYTKLKK